MLEVGEERDAAAQQATDAEAAVQAARQELEAAVAQRDAQLRQVMEAQQRLAQQLEASEVAEQVRHSLHQWRIAMLSQDRFSGVHTPCARSVAALSQHSCLLHRLCLMG